jgi:selenocysteine-specific elongation factor
LATQPRRFVASSRLDQLAQDAANELTTRLAGEEVSAGIPTRDFAAGLLSRRALTLADVYLEELRGRGALELSEGRVVPIGSDGHMTAAGAELTRQVEAIYRDEGFSAPAPGEVAQQLQAKPVTVEGICRYLLQRRRLVRLDGKFLIHRAVLDELARQVRAWNVEEFGVGDFKEKVGLTRKLAIPALEWLDSEHVTVRQGNKRKVLRPKG